MLRAVSQWLGVDVGGKRKGFDVAVIDERQVVDIQSRLDREAVARMVEIYRPVLVAIDAPRCCAPEGQSARAGERQVRSSICGIRWTPDAQRAHGSPYYAWIVHGLDLFDDLVARVSR
jgi:predicted nuclease with RNAse H fold